jgi:hypothetical protein
MPHNPASIVRLLYGERVAEEKTAPKRFLSFFQSCQQQFDIRRSHRSLAATPKWVVSGCVRHPGLFGRQ